MGRSPFFADHVKPVQTKNSLQDLDDIFHYFFNVGKKEYYDDNTETAKITNNEKIYLRVIQSEYSQTPLLERSCSIYRKLEDHFPDKDNIYYVSSVCKYKFNNQYSGNEPFEFDVLELKNIDERYYTTFCVKTDGAILNIESLSLRGYISKLVVASSIENL